MLRSVIIALSLLLCCATAKMKPFFVYNNLDPDFIYAARKYGEILQEEFTNMTADITDDEKLDAIYFSQFEKCNYLGWEYMNDVASVIEKSVNKTRAKLLSKVGLKPYVARVLTTAPKDVATAITYMCKKAEMQFQCQLTFGESMSAIKTRIEKLRESDGDMRMLFDKDCIENKQKGVNYPCIGNKVETWTADCLTEIEAYNRTRFELGEKIVELHKNAVLDSENVIRKHGVNDANAIVPIEVITDNILRKALKNIVKIEGEVCHKLDIMLKCVTPALRTACGNDASDAVRTSILVGYLISERSEALQYSMEQLDINPDRRCVALKP